MKRSQLVSYINYFMAILAECTKRDIVTVKLATSNVKFSDKTRQLIKTQINHFICDI